MAPTQAHVHGGRVPMVRVLHERAPALRGRAVSAAATRQRSFLSAGASCYAMNFIIYEKRNMYMKMQNHINDKARQTRRATRAHFRASAPTAVPPRRRTFMEGASRWSASSMNVPLLFGGERCPQPLRGSGNI